MRRPLLLGAAWTASAAAAVGLGFLAVSLVDASASPGTVPAGATGSTAPSVTPTPEASPQPTAEYATAGGTVYADCGGGAPVVAGAPAAGWSVDDSPDPGEVEFRSGAQEVEVHVTCADGVPVFALDDSGGAAVTPAAPTATTPPAPTPSVPAVTPAPDDSGGGHGSDDPPGDDRGGDSGGGHGSDDDGSDD
ncbi:hypothetical protein [Geodermatophilus sp. SYSU D01036]